MIGSVTPEERYATIVEALVSRLDVTPGSGEPGPRHRFGSSELKVRGRIFAMLVRGGLVVKLPRKRVDALVASGAGERFDPRRDGRLMKEWLTVDPASEERWLPLATEAMEFVASRG
jgi:TfoX/Sxy family transcriptional regulator of competence genes